MTSICIIGGPSKADVQVLTTDGQRIEKCLGYVKVPQVEPRAQFHPVYAIFVEANVSELLGGPDYSNDVVAGMSANEWNKLTASITHDRERQVRQLQRIILKLEDKVTALTSDTPAK